MDSEVSFPALDNDVVMDVIFGLLKTPDLLRCRKVSRKWNTGATSTLKRRRVYLKSTNGDASEYNELLQLMQTSPDFPFRGFRFTLVGSQKQNTVDSPAAKKFFKQFGPTFQHLYLHCESIRSQDLAKLLSSFLPNLETIKLGRFSIKRECRGQTIHQSLSNLTLPKLRRVNIKDRNGYDMLPIEEADLTILLRAATGLEKIEGHLRTEQNYEGILLSISATNNLTKISSLTLENNAKVNAAVYQSLLRNPPSALVHLSLRDTVWSGRERGFSEFPACVRAVLVSSAETLRSLFFGKVPLHGNSPVFPKLKALTLEQGYPAVSHNIGGLYEKFRAVREICFFYPHVTEESLRRAFGEEGVVWSSVVKLDFGFGGVSTDGMKRLANMFPAVTHVAVDFAHFFGCKEEWLSTFSSLSELKSLEKLEINYITQDEETTGEFHVDELLTGMPRSVCRMVRTRPPLTLPEHCSEVMRPFGGIFQLRGTRLKELVLDFDSDFYFQSGRGNFISKASVWYGLELIPGLRTIAIVSRKKANKLAAALEEPVKQFVTIVAD